VGGLLLSSKFLTKQSYHTKIVNHLLFLVELILAFNAPVPVPVPSLV
jgi:hypothetical protein